MIRRIAFSVLVGLASFACSESVTPLPAERFTGTWRSISAPYEHLRLRVLENATLAGRLQVRLTFSGVAWEGPGRIEADSLIMDVTTAAVSGAKVIAHRTPSGSLSVDVASDTAAPLKLTFIREYDTPAGVP